MKLRLSFGFMLFSLAMASACGGGDKAAETSITEPSAEVDNSTVVLDFGGSETTPQATAKRSLFDGFSSAEVDQSNMVVELDSPDVAKVGEETVFVLEAPVACEEVPIGSDIDAKQVIFDLHWSCFYRPKVVNDNNDWLLGLDMGKYTRAELRKKVSRETRESDCMRGGSCDGIIIPSELGENVRVECNFDSVTVPDERAQIRIQHICGNSLDVIVVS